MKNCGITQKLCMYFLLSILWTPTIPFAEAEGTQAERLQYKVYYGAKECGTLEIKLSDQDFEGRSVSRVEVDLQVKLKYFLLSVYYMHSNEEALIDASGTFRYVKNSKEGPTETMVVGNRGKDSFKFEIKEKGRTREIIVRHDDYDYTSMDEPALKEQGREQKHRVLNLDKTRVEDHVLTWIRNEELIVGGEPIESRVIEFQTPSESGTRWVTPDLGLLIKEEGKDKDGEYSLKLVQLAD